MRYVSSKDLNNSSRRWIVHVEGIGDVDVAATDGFISKEEAIDYAEVMYPNSVVGRARPAVLDDMDDHDPN